MNIAIAITAWRRPDYLREVLNSLARCRTVADHDIFISIDGGYPQERATMLSDIANFRQQVFPDSEERVNLHTFEENQGCAANIGHTFRHIFTPAQSPFTLTEPESNTQNLNRSTQLPSPPRPYDAAIFLEDDTVPTPDFLTYCRAMLERFADDERIFSISGYTRMGEPGNHLDRPERGIHSRKGFTPWGWATWLDRATPIAQDWFGATGNEAAKHLSGSDFREAINEDPRGSWAWPMNRYWRADRQEIAPSIGRIQNIGAENGAFCPGGSWHRKNHHTENLMSEEQSAATNSAEPRNFVIA